MTQSTGLHWWQRATHALTASGPGSRLAARVLPRLDKAVLRASGQRFTLSSLMIDVPVVMLTTVGARSGLPRTVPLLAFPEGAALIVIASSFGNTQHPAWYRNLRAQPAVQVALPGQPARPYRAREAQGEERARYWQRAARAYAGYERYRQRAGERVIPVIVLEPVQEA